MTDGRTLARGAVWSICGTGLSIVAGIVFSAFLFRAVGSTDFGQYLIIVAAVGLLGALQSGLPQFLVRELSAELKSGVTSTAVVAGVTLHYLLAIVISASSVAAAVIVWVTMQSGGVAAIVLSQGFALAIATMNAPRQAAASSVEAWGILLISQLTSSASRLLLALLLLAWPTLYAAAIAVAGAALVEFFSLRLILSRFGIAIVRPVPRSLRHVRPVLEFSGPLLALSFVGYLLSSGNTLIIGGLLSAAQVATYRLANTFPYQVQSLLQSLFPLLWPRIAGKEEVAGRSGMLGASRLLCGIAGAGFGLMIGAGFDFLKILYGDVPPAVAPLIPIFSIVYMIDFWFHAAVVYATIRGKAHHMARWAPAELVFSLAATVALVSIFGVMGVALAALATVLFTDFFVYFRLASRLGGIGHRMILRSSAIPSLLTFVPTTLLCLLVAHLANGPWLRIVCMSFIAALIAVISVWSELPYLFLGRQRSVRSKRLR